LVQGWGEPCFDKLEAVLAHAMLSIPATKGFEIGSGAPRLLAATVVVGDVYMARSRLMFAFLVAK